MAGLFLYNNMADLRHFQKKKCHVDLALEVSILLPGWMTTTCLIIEQGSAKICSITAFLAARLSHLQADTFLTARPKRATMNSCEAVGCVEESIPLKKQALRACTEHPSSRPLMAVE